MHHCNHSSSTAQALHQRELKKQAKPARKAALAAAPAPDRVEPAQKRQRLISASEQAEVEKKKKAAAVAETARTKRALEKVGAPRHTMS